MGVTENVLLHNHLVVCVGVYAYYVRYIFQYIVNTAAVHAMQLKWRSILDLGVV